LKFPYRDKNFWYFSQRDPYRDYLKSTGERKSSILSSGNAATFKTILLPFFLDEKGPKNHGSEDHFEAISGSVAVVSEIRQLPENHSRSPRRMANEMVFETGLSKKQHIEFADT
jgi:hypothetical protein